MIIASRSSIWVGREGFPLLAFCDHPLLEHDTRNNGTLQQFEIPSIRRVLLGNRQRQDKRLSSAVVLTPAVYRPKEVAGFGNQAGNMTRRNSVRFANLSRCRQESYIPRGWNQSGSSGHVESIPTRLVEHSRTSRTRCSCAPI